MSEFRVVNNGARLCNDLAFWGELKHGLSIEDIVKIVQALTGNSPECRFMDQNEDESTFWEDFIDRAEELGIKLKL